MMLRNGQKLPVIRISNRQSIYRLAAKELKHQSFIDGFRHRVCWWKKAPHLGAQDKRRCTMSSVENCSLLVVFEL
jgi:hypothetical protein